MSEPSAAPVSLEDVRQLFAWGSDGADFKRVEFARRTAFNEWFEEQLRDARTAAIHELLKFVRTASGGAYNGSTTDKGQAFYDNGLNPWLDEIAARFLGAETAPVDQAARATDAESEQRWRVGVDWMLNHGDAFDLAPRFFAYVDGLITLQELRRETVTLETINRRRAKAEATDG